MYHSPALIELGKPPAGSTGRADWRLKRILELTAGTTDSQLTLNELSQQLGISPGQLSRLFVRVTGQRFRNFVMAHRLLQASRLLLETGMQIKQIAAELGYGHSRDFCHRFKAVFGMTPKEFRERARAEAALHKDGGASAVTENEVERNNS